MPSESGADWLHREVNSPLTQARSSVSHVCNKNTKVFCGKNNTGYNLCHTSLSRFPGGVVGGVKGMWQCCYSGPGMCWVSLLPFVSLAPTSRHLQQKYSGHQKPLFKKGRYNQLQHHQHHHCYSWISLFSSSFQVTNENSAYNKC